MSDRVLLFPVKPTHAARYLAGRKTAEVRRRPIGCASGGRVALYATAPTKALVAVATVERIVVLPGSASPYEWADVLIPIWDRIELSADELRDYLEPAGCAPPDGASRGIVVLLHSVRPVSPAVPLAALRQEVPGGFVPPQSWCWLSGLRATRVLQLSETGGV